MFGTTRALGIAYIFMILSALLHLATPILGGFTSFSISFAIAGIIWIVFAQGVRHGYRWLAWLSFLIALIGVSTALAFAMGQSSVPAYIFQGVALCDLLTAIALFCHLWMPKRAAS